MSSKNSNKLNVPQARAAMDKFKMEAANEVGVNLKEGYNGDLTSREAGSVGGQMVKNTLPVRKTKFERESRTDEGHQLIVKYVARLE
ncbi:MAG: alpha/beta-type small acid-soluble spore protein [Eubacteriales bacterium]|nr:alpha/beta-type small acid-soluble spore protein [Eubacteriales bacterium]